MQGVCLQSLRLIAALPAEPQKLGQAFDVDDVVQRCSPGDGRGGPQGGTLSRGEAPGVTGQAGGDAQVASRTSRMKGLVIRTPRGIQDYSQDLDTGYSVCVPVYLFYPFSLPQLLQVRVSPLSRFAACLCRLCLASFFYFGTVVVSPTAAQVSATVQKRSSSMRVSRADHMDPDADEVQVAWEDGTVENTKCRGLTLGGLSFPSNPRETLSLSGFFQTPLHDEVASSRAVTLAFHGLLCMSLPAVDRCLFVGDTVLEGSNGAIGLVLEVQQSIDVAIPIEAFKAGVCSIGDASALHDQRQQPQPQQQYRPQQQQHCALQGVADDGIVAGERPRLPSRLAGIRSQVMGAAALSLDPPLMQQLQQFNEGMPVVSGGRLGCVIGGKVDYVVALDSGHEFTLEEGMVGVRPEPRRGHPMSWISGLYPSLPVYATGEWIRHFQSQIERMHGGAHSNQNAADAGRLCKGCVKSFAIRNIKVAWQLQAPLGAAGSHRSLAPWTEHQPKDLLPLQQPVMRLGQPVYVDVRRLLQQREGGAKRGSQKDVASCAAAAAPTALAEAAPGAAFGSPTYTVGVVDAVCTTCTVLWETGVLEKNVQSHRLTPVALDRTPLAPADCRLAPVLLPHMVVQRQRPKEVVGAAAQGPQGPPRPGAPEETAALPWWLNLHFGGLQVGSDTSVESHLAEVQRHSGGARLFKEVSLALGADEGAFQGRANHAALLQAAAAHRRHRAQRQTRGITSTRGDSRTDAGPAEGPTAPLEEAQEGSQAPRRAGGDVSVEEGPLVTNRLAAFAAARDALPLLLRFMTETDVVYQMLDIPGKRLPLLRTGSSAPSHRRLQTGESSRGPEGGQGPLERPPTGGPSGVSDVPEAPTASEAQGDDDALVFHGAQALAADIFSFDGGPSLEAVAAFLHLVYSHGQWGVTEADGDTEEKLRDLFEATALVLGDAGPEVLMDDAPQSPGAADVQLGIVVYVQRKEKKALVAWIKDTQQFTSLLRAKHSEFFSAAAANAYVMPAPILKAMQALGVTPFTAGLPHPPHGPDVFSTYKEAEGLLKEEGWTSVVALQWEPYGAISVQPQHLFFPGDLAVVRPDRIPGNKVSSTEEAPCDARVFLEVVGFCGGTVWGRTLDGVLAPFVASDLLPLIFRRLEDLLDEASSSEEGSEYSHEGSDLEEGEWEEDASGSDSTNITSLSAETRSSGSSRDTA
ncbi:hypothetical protein cyc_03891 [Cyclospora cayetanensis]|uniref:Uncharacterized protein n=1 Tax=Cyclospora cayetanensis TaxID=88456 RepID=A0A1D3CWG5_9EIME|nr:hypothetical protein cyc_03891 [Cyclospora cayetanensis]